MRTFTIFGQDDRVLFLRNDAISAEVRHERYELSAVFPLDETQRLERGQRIAYVDDSGVWQAYEIRVVETSVPDNEQDVTAEYLPMAELSGDATEVLKIGSEDATAALDDLLFGSLWQRGNVISTTPQSIDLSMQDKWKALTTLRDTYGVRLGFRVETDATGITARYVDIVSNVPVFRGVRLALDRNIQKANVTYDDTDTYTAMYGYGATITGDDGSSVKLDFSTAVWATPGDPADKPIGQKYVEDPVAKAAYGRNGRNRFGFFRDTSIKTATELLTATWTALQAANTPKFTCDATIHNLYAYGYSGEQILLGDEVQVVIAPANVRATATVTKLTEDLLNPENTKPTIGSAKANILYQTASNSNAASLVEQIASSNPDLIRGVINTAVTKILSTSTKRYTDTDGGEVYESADGLGAVKFTGNGIMLADGKTGDVWNWTVAISGKDGINANLIKTGTLYATLVTILGSENFYITGDVLYIKNPSNPSQQMRIGQYTSGEYGIGYTRDSGATWQVAMDFNGLNVSASGFSKNYVSETTPSGSFNLADMWDRHVNAKTCQTLLDSYTCQFLLDNLTCDEILNGSDTLYTWDGAVWGLVYNSQEVADASANATQALQTTTQYATQIAQNTAAIALKASQSTVDAQGTRLSSAEASILLNAQQILQRVEKSGIISSINQTAESIKIQAALIALEGIITANGNFKILTDGSMDAAGKLRAGNWVFDNAGATYTENGTVLFQIMMDSAQGASVSSDLTKRLFLEGREMYFWNAATSGAVILGQDAAAGYVQQCFYPTTTRSGNLGTPSHIWDTASIRAVFRESEGGLSSRKIKKGIRELKSVSKIVDALKAVTFIYRGDPRQKRHYGMIYEDTE